MDYDAHTSVVKNVTLQAQWNQKCTVTFYKEGIDGTRTKVSDKTVYQLEKVGTLPTLPTEEGITYTWNHTANDVVNEDMDVIAKAARTQVSVTFDANGGSAASPASKSLNYGDTIGTLPTTMRTGYIFDGCTFVKWNGGTESVSDRRVVDYGNAIGSLPVKTKAGFDFMGWYDEANNRINPTDLVTKDVKANAKWKPKTYELRFHGCGGNATADKQTEK